MKRNKRPRFRNGFSQTLYKFFNMFTLCSREPPSCIIQDSSYSNTLIMATPLIKRSNIHSSENRRGCNGLKLSFYPTTFTPIDQPNFSPHLMPEIILVDSKLRTRTHHKTEMMRHVVNDEHRTSGQLYRESVPSFSSTSSSPTSNCHLSLTIHQCYPRSKVPTATSADIQMLSTSTSTMEESLSPHVPTSSRFSYLIRPSTPCIFGRENCDDDELVNDDEFFLTAGAIIHSCPNIYELSTDDNRKLQSCDHLLFIGEEEKSIDHNTLNCYDTELNRYSILPRFHQSLSSISTGSVDSELQLYRERHATGFSRQCPDDMSIYSSFLPTTWRSDNYLFLLPLVHHQNSSSTNSITHGKRSRSYDIPLGQTYSPIVV